MKELGIGQSEWKGTKYWDRTTFVVDPKGVIRQVYEKVNPEGHEKVLLDDIQAMQKKACEILSDLPINQDINLCLHDENKS